MHQHANHYHSIRALMNALKTDVKPTSHSPYAQSLPGCGSVISSEDVTFFSNLKIGGNHAARIEGL